MLSKQPPTTTPFFPCQVPLWLCITYTCAYNLLHIRMIQQCQVFYLDKTVSTGNIQPQTFTIHIPIYLAICCVRPKNEQQTLLSSGKNSVGGYICSFFHPLFLPSFFFFNEAGFLCSAGLPHKQRDWWKTFKDREDIATKHSVVLSTRFLYLLVLCACDAY